MNEIQELKELGLTEYEAKAYTTLVKLGKSSSAEIAKESGVSYGKIYSVLSTLEQKHLVKVVPEKTKKFIATNPENLMKLIKEKETIFEDLKNKVKEMKKIYESTPKEAIIIVQGKRNFYKIVKKQPKPQKYMYTIRYETERQPIWKREHTAYLKKGIDDKALVRYTEETKKNIKDWWIKFMPHTRKLENEGIAMSMVDDKYMFIVFTKANTIVEITYKPFIKIMKKMFKETYKNAEEIK
ncbi:hypothetical protein B6U93_00020 [Candidatus Woesearchaeota archaeon ex4484_78]|nr:MAG: hypothetical protein B6U93_00020 [Candidatus Woesearchaeota archaeon ex4484_78]